MIYEKSFKRHFGQPLSSRINLANPVQFAKHETSGKDWSNHSSLGLKNELNSDLWP